MPLSPGGVYTLPGGYLAVTGQDILPSQHNPPLEDIASVLSEAFYRTGVAPMLANLNFNTFKGTNLANGTQPTDAINLSQLTGSITAPNANTLIFDNQNIMIEAASSVVTTGVNGEGVIIFPTQFTLPPIVIAVGGDNAANTSTITLQNSVTLEGFHFFTTPIHASASIRINWIAIGSKL